MSRSRDETAAVDSMLERSPIAVRKVIRNATGSRYRAADEAEIGMCETVMANNLGRLDYFVK